MKLFVLALLWTQLHAVARAWAEAVGWPAALVPDPFALLVAGAALGGAGRAAGGRSASAWGLDRGAERNALLLAALSLGLGRALVLAEPAGGQVLCAALAVLLIGGQRSSFDRRSAAGWALAALLVALCWWAGGALLAWLSGAPVSGGPALACGAALAWPWLGLRARWLRLRGIPA
ncbi:MAG: hypothetical protein ACT4PU_09970 [Planctomycetota bacterium]